MAELVCVYRAHVMYAPTSAAARRWADSDDEDEEVEVAEGQGEVRSMQIQGWVRGCSKSDVRGFARLAFAVLILPFLSKPEPTTPQDGSSSDSESSSDSSSSESESEEEEAERGASSPADDSNGGGAKADGKASSKQQQQQQPTQRPLSKKERCVQAGVWRIYHCPSLLVH